jgi:protein SCO1/2
MRNARLTGLLLALFGVFFVSVGGARSEDTARANPAIGGPFRLMSHIGAVVDSRDLAGHPYAVFFGFTHCPVICPTTLGELSNDLDELGPVAKDFRIFFITVDPEQDRPEILKDYMSNFNPQIVGLSPSTQELAEVAKSFHVSYDKVPTADGSYTMDHTVFVYLMDRHGKLFGLLAPGLGPDIRQKKLRALFDAP